MNMNQCCYTIRTFIPLLGIFSVIALFVIVRQWVWGVPKNEAMYDFMGAFFVVFGLFKLVNLNKFVIAFLKYDIVAQKSIYYAYLYPFIELSLGIAYLMRWNLFWVNIITIVVMSLGAVGVALVLRKGESMTCACLGAVFKLPMTYVTLFEDVIMIIMAIMMLAQ